MLLLEALLAVQESIRAIHALHADMRSLAVGAATGLVTVVTGWLGRALLASSAGVVVAIWRSPAFGTMAGAAVWLRPAWPPASSAPRP